MADVHIFLLLHRGVAHPFGSKHGGGNHKSVGSDAREIVVVDSVDVSEIVRFEVDRIGFDASSTRSPVAYQEL